MAFLQHFLPGQPLEKNAQSSGGMQWRVSGSDAWQWTAGGLAETFSAALSQRQDGPTVGSAFLVATRPPGTHYDYHVTGSTLAAFYDAALDLAPDWRLVASGRVERNAFDYDNRHLDGNTKDDGNACGFGGCLYTRPADPLHQCPHSASS
jgi:outer membrane receptor protein involved in Fe transport